MTKKELSLNEIIRRKKISKITIEKDGWVWVNTRDGKHEMGLGDIDVDVEIEDKRI